MGGGASKDKNALTEKQVHKYVKETGFSPSELEFLFRRFRFLSKNQDSLSKSDLNDNANLSGNRYVTRLFNILPKNEIGCVNFDSFVRAAGVFRPDKPLDGKLNYIFDLFDFKMDDTLDPSELKEMIKLAKPDLPDAEMEELVASTVKDILSKSSGVSKKGTVHRRDFVQYGKQLPGVDKLLTLNLAQHLS